MLNIKGKVLKKISNSIAIFKDVNPFDTFGFAP